MSGGETDQVNRARLDALFRSEPFARLLGVDLVDWGGGEATMRWVPGPEHRNFVGGVHGGALFSFADAALAVASNSWGRVCDAHPRGLVAGFSAVVYRTDRWHLGPEAWADEWRAGH